MYQKGMIIVVASNLVITLNQTSIVDHVLMRAL